MRKSILLPLLILICVLFVVFSYIKAYSVSGNSDAPGFIAGDRIIVNLASYDLYLPFTSVKLVKLKDPARWDYILFRHTDNTLIFKRVVAVPGDRIELKTNHLILNGDPITYSKVDSSISVKLQAQCNLGTVLEVENYHDTETYITFTPGMSTESDILEQIVPDDHYFVLGSNRDNSMDSRHFGCVSREHILGRVWIKL